MFKRILVANDGLPTAEKGLATALEYARDHGAKVVSLSVEEGPPSYLSRNEEQRREVNDFFARVQARAKERAQMLDVPLETVTKYGGNPAKVIVDTAKEGSFDLVVLGAKGHAALEFLLGSTTDQVSDYAPCSVMIVR